jgi:DNA-binding transcriptional MerR regulator
MSAGSPDKEVFKAAEVCRMADVAPYVLKYWQTEFPFLSDGKDKGPNRTYTRREVQIIARVRQLLYDEGFTIAGAKKKIEAEIAAGEFDAAPAGAGRGKKGAAAAPRPAAPPPTAKAAASNRKAIVRELREILKILDKPVSR